MIYYHNTDDGEIEAIHIDPKRPDEDTATLLVPEFQSLLNFDFNNFNYFTFEQDVTDMSASQFEWWYENIFQPWLEDLDKNYFDIDFDNIRYQFQSQEEKRIFLLKLVNFIMFLLPYQILRGVFSDLEFDSTQEILDFLNEDIHLIQLRHAIIEALDKSMLQVDDFVNTLLKMEKSAKKNLVEENIQLLDDHVKKQNLFIEIFKELMLETDMEKIRDFIKILLENDAKNIL